MLVHVTNMSNSDYKEGIGIQWIGRPKKIQKRTWVTNHPCAYKELLILSGNPFQLSSFETNIVPSLAHNKVNKQQNHSALVIAVFYFFFFLNFIKKYIIYLFNSIIFFYCLLKIFLNQKIKN